MDIKNMSQSEIEGKIKSLTYISYAVGSAGTITGFVYANKTGGGFWRYVGFGLAGGIAFGIINYLTTFQLINKYQTELQNRGIKTK